MAEEKTAAGGVEITTGDKSTGQTALESAPILGNAVKTFQAGAKLTDGATGSEIQGVMSEGAGLISAATGVAGIATDPIGWLVGQGLNFLISVVQPLQDAIHFVSGDGPALSQAAGNFSAICDGLVELRGKFEEELGTSLKEWGGEASEAAGTKLGEFAKGIDGVAGQAGDLAQLLQMSSMVMTVIEDFIKAILTELITWLIMIWIPALAAAVPTAGASTAAAGTATTAKAATTGSKVSRMIAKLKEVLQKIMTFLRNLRSRMGNLRNGFKQAMDNKRLQSALAEGHTSPLAKLMGKDGMVGQRVQQGFGQSMGNAVNNTAKAQVGIGPQGEFAPDKALRNTGNATSAAEHGQTGADQSTEETAGYLDI